MDQGRVNGIVRSELSKAVRPLLPSVRASILNIPTYGDKHTGLRVRISRTVESWAKIEAGVVTAGVAVNSAKMPSGQKSLPLMMEGVKRWRHPVYGNRNVWVAQESHPYFYQAVAFFGPASRLAIDRALQRISDAISG